MARKLLELASIALKCDREMGLVGATETNVAASCPKEPVDVIGAAVLHLNLDEFPAAAFSPLVNAHFSQDYTFIESGMSTIHPCRIACTTSVLRWTRGRHLRPCSSLETIPATEVPVALFRILRYVVRPSVCISQGVVVLASIR